MGLYARDLRDGEIVWRVSEWDVRWAKVGVSCVRDNVLHQRLLW